jgi:purine-binding chemotaxis protein CheW
MENKVLVFILSGQEFALDIALVQEVVNKTKISKVPKVPEIISGVINYRGNIIPVIDLKKVLDYKSDINDDKKQRLVIISKGDLCYGVIVDEAKEVITIDSSQIEQVQNVLQKKEKESCCKGIAKIDKRIICILDLASIECDIAVESV